MRLKNRGNEGEVALKLDISKTYDRVSWKFLKQKLLVMNFCSKWVDWMILCVRTVTYHFCLNDSLVGPVVPKRGLRQGDPLSPYLFLICVEGLSHSLDQVASSGSIHGCKFSPTAPAISHLLFADDNFLRFKGTTEEASCIKVLLSAYESSSGQSINYQKSEIYFSANICKFKHNELSGILGVHNDNTNTKYPRLPYLVGRSKKRVFCYLKEWASKRIKGGRRSRWENDPDLQCGSSYPNIHHLMFFIAQVCSSPSIMK